MTLGDLNKCMTIFISTELISSELSVATQLTDKDILVSTSKRNCYHGESENWNLPFPSRDFSDKLLFSYSTCCLSGKPVKYRPWWRPQRSGSAVWCAVPSFQWWLPLPALGCTHGPSPALEPENTQSTHFITYTEYLFWNKMLLPQLYSI